MNLLDLINRPPVPGPWSEGEKIPWNEPGFSARMLKEHLNQSHDAASRRTETIDRQASWIHNRLLSGQPSRILDLGCGPGLYTCRFAQLGHECMGIDFSPASIAYAAAFAADDTRSDRLSCTYLQQDIRLARYGEGFRLAMLIFGEFNMFTPSEARTILLKIYKALEPGGILLLEPHTFAAVQKIASQPHEWHSVKAALFSDKPHVYLTESFWDAATATATTRYFIIDAASAQVARYASTTQAYSEEQYCRMIRGAGFEDIHFFPSLTGVEDPAQADFFAIVARKPATAQAQP